MSVTLRSFAKINLGLAIGLARPDGYHGLATVYQTIALHDLVTVAARRAQATRITLTSNDGRVPTDAGHRYVVDRMLADVGEHPLEVWTVGGPRALARIYELGNDLCATPHAVARASIPLHRDGEPFRVEVLADLLCRRDA